MVWQATSQNFGKNGWEGQSAYTFLTSGYTKDAVSRVNTLYEVILPGCPHESALAS